MRHDEAMINDEVNKKCQGSTDKSIEKSNINRQPPASLCTPPGLPDQQPDSLNLTAKQ